MAADEAIAATQGEGAIPFKPLCTAAAWTAASAAAVQNEWVTVLSPAEVAELLAATKHVLSTDKAIQVRCRSEMKIGGSQGHTAAPTRAFASTPHRRLSLCPFWGRK